MDPDVSRNELMVLIEGSTVEIASEAHRSGHSEAGDFARWGRLGGLETLRRYGRPWFALLGRRCWGRIGAEVLDLYRAELAAKAGGGVMAAPLAPRSAGECKLRAGGDRDDREKDET